MESSDRNQQKKYDIGKLTLHSEPRTNSLIRNVKSENVRFLISAGIVLKNISVSHKYEYLLLKKLICIFIT
jgi:hypothetical protein